MSQEGFKVIRNALTSQSINFSEGSTKTRNPESGNGKGITETEYGIRERMFQAIELKKIVTNDNKITQQIKRKDVDE